MFGKTEILPYAVILMALIASITDLLYGKIYNWFTFSAALLGLVFSFVSLGWSGLLYSLLAMALGLLLYGWMFALGFLGGGDVKLLMVLGAWGGTRYVLEVGVLAVLVGGILSLGILIGSGRIFDFGKRMKSFLYALMIRELEFHLPRIDRSSTLPFGIPLSIAAVLCLYFHPLTLLGVLP